MPAGYARNSMPEVQALYAATHTQVNFTSFAGAKLIKSGLAQCAIVALALF